MNPGRLLFFLANISLSFSFNRYFVRRCFNILRDSFFQIIIISNVAGASIAYLTFVLSADNPFGISLQNFLPFLYGRLIVEEICPFVAFITVLSQCCINNGVELYHCAKRGELEILHIYKINPVGIYITPFIISSVLLGIIACAGFIISSFGVILLMVYLSEPGYFSINAEKYWSMIRTESTPLIFIKIVLFSLFTSLTISYYAIRPITKPAKFNVSMVIAVSLLLSLTLDFTIQLFRN